MNSAKQTVLAAVEKNRDLTIGHLQEFLRRPSPQGQEKEAQLYYAAQLKALTGEVDVWDPVLSDTDLNPYYLTRRTYFTGSPNVVGVLKGIGGGRSMILNGHVDVVPAGDNDWVDEPFSGALKDGRIYGRGASDMKGGLIANLMAVKAIIDAGLKLKGDVIVQSVIEEETGGTGTLSAIKRGYKADAAIIPEPTDLRVCPVSLGAMWFRVIVRGRSAHAGTAHLGVNAIVKMAKIVAAIDEFDARRAVETRHPLYGYLPRPFSLNVGSISGGVFPTSVPDYAVIEGRMGVSPEETVPEARAALEKALAEAADQDPWLKEHPPVLEWYGFCLNSGAIAVDHELVKLAVANFTELKGQTPGIVGTPWGTDGGALNRFANVPVLIVGPGPGGTAHQANENVEVSQLMDSTKIIAMMLLDWCGYQE